VAGRTQQALYAEIALDLSWSEDEGSAATKTSLRGWGCRTTRTGRPRRNALPYPLTYFDFDHAVKLGDAFWNFVGDDLRPPPRPVRAVGEEYAEKLDELREALAGRPV
jgi:hypothetical protein